MEYSSLIKAESPSICDNVAGTWGHYAKGNKSDRERKTMYDQKVQTFSYKWTNSRSLMYSRVTIGNHSLLYTWKLLREDSFDALAITRAKW